MPELPEVEIIKLGLAQKIIGRTIKKIQVLNKSSLIGNPNLIEGKKVVGVLRRAKMLQIDLDEELSLLIHLKMSGQLIYESFSVIPAKAESDLAKVGIHKKWTPDQVRNGNNRFIGGHPTQDMLGKMPNPHTRVIFSFSDRSKLYFNDQRKFGWIRIVKGDEFGKVSKIFSQLGPEPLEKQFSWQELKDQLLRHKKMSIKAAIMDQSVVSGIGNIYACEACFLAGINPRVEVDKLSDKQIKKLRQGIIKALKNGIKYGGSSRSHFVDSAGNKGFFLDYAYCYGRDKSSCKICSAAIKKIKVAGRGTYYCPSCQKGYNIV